MKELYQYFTKVRKELKFLLLLAIATYFSIELWFKNYSELFEGANKIGDFFSKLSLAYVTSFIFYFIVVHIKSEKDKKNVNEFVGHEVYQIITCARLLIQPLQQKNDLKASFQYLDSSDLYKLLASIDRKAKEAPLSINGEKANWVEWYSYLKKKSQKHIAVIFIRYPHLDTKVVRILTRIENSLFFSQFEMLYDTSHDNTLKFYHVQIQTYLNHIKELEKYAEKNYKEFQYLTSDFIGWDQNGR